MKRFIRHILIFSLCVLVPLVAAEIYVEHLPNPSRSKHQWMLEHSRNVRTLILGSSHTLYGVNPNLFPDTAFSLAQVAQTYRYDEYLLKHYPMPQLRTVILSYSYFSLYEDFENMPRERYNAIRYRLYMDCDIHPRISYYGFEFSSIDALTEKLKTLYRPARVSWDARGWGTDFTFEARPTDWNNGQEAATNNTYTDTTLVPLNVAFLDSIMDYCTRHQWQLLLITTPLSPNFIENQLPQQTQRNASVLHALLQRHPDVKYIDFTNDTLFTERDFYDSHHLNHYGAEKLTLAILRRLSE